MSKYDGQNWTNYKTSNSQLASDKVISILEDSLGQMWFATDAGLSVLSGVSWTTYTTGDGLASNIVQDLALGQPPVTMWIATRGGLNKLEGDSLVTYTTADGLADNWIFAIAVDSAGAVWCGTIAGGVSKFDGSTWTTYSTEDGLGANQVRAVAIDPKKNLWFGTNGGGATKFDGSTWKTFTTDDGLAHNDVRGIAYDSKNGKWFATMGGGVTHVKSSIWTTYSIGQGLPSNEINNIVIDSLDNVWCGTNNGVAVIASVGNGPQPQVPLNACDLNEDGAADINDVITLLLIGRANPDSSILDWNEDGHYGISDAISLLINIIYGTCPDAGSMLMLASAEVISGGNSQLSHEEIKYIERMLALMDLTPEQEALFSVALYGNTGAAKLPKAFSLAQNIPNPFNPATTIVYSAPEGMSVHVSLKVFDIRGKLVRTLVEGERQAGSYTVFWDGADNAGREVSSGVYFYRMQAGDYLQTRKMVLVK